MPCLDAEVCQALTRTLRFAQICTKVLHMSFAPPVTASFTFSGTRCPAEARAVAAATAIPALVVQAKGHGHAGTAMALAPVMHVLYQRVLLHDPADPAWPRRDRFILSAGHASLALYTQLYLTGYGLTLDDLAASRTLDATTPGHPELGHTSGVEMSTGPLGQGVASAVGLALAARRDSARHDDPSIGEGYLWNPTVYVLAGDGCLQEGVSAEASSLAGALGLSNLVLIWDDNGITIDNETSLNFSEDVRARYRAYGWQVIEVDNCRDLDAIAAALLKARGSSQPTLVAVRTIIAGSAPTRAGTSAAHAGPLGADAVAGSLAALGFASEATLADLVDDETLAWARQVAERGQAERLAWERRRDYWAEHRPELALARARLAAAFRGESLPANATSDSTPPARASAVSALDALALPPAGASVATRKTSGEALRALVAAGFLWGGSCDLSESTCVAVPGQPVSAGLVGNGDFIPFGIREHAMAAILSGIALHGLWRPYGSTYLAFSDYARPAIRLAALMKLPVIYVFTHDSLAVGEDGPTHQPVEQVAALRTISGLSVIRPADATETLAAWRLLMEPGESGTPNAAASSLGPVALILSRQDLPVLPHLPGDAIPSFGTAPASTNATDEKAPGGDVFSTRIAGVSRGGYVVWQHGDGHDLAIIATGSEVSLAIEAARRLATENVAGRVISMPCVEWFEAASQEWRDTVLPPTLRARVAIEAGRGDAWYRWVGLDGEVVSVERFGESGSGAQVLTRAGITTESILTAAHTTLTRTA